MTHPYELQYRFGDLLFCPNSGRLFRASREIRVAPLSRKLLSALVRHAPEALSAEDLQREVWDGRYVTQATIKQRVKLLRRAIDVGSLQAVLCNGLVEKIVLIPPLLVRCVKQSKYLSGYGQAC